VPKRPSDASGIDRRRFLQSAAMLAVGAPALLSSRSARAEAGAEWPAMPYRALGRTGWNASRLVFGCGAALSRGRRDELLEVALEAGINVFDVGFRGYYDDAEKNLAPFLARHRDQVFLISKAIAARPDPDASLTATECREAATTWSGRLDDSLRELRVERVDAYYLMASNNVDLVSSDSVTT
jgi:aryl-alcohol dehydrogenase-like predicted oxidoreductase